MLEGSDTASNTSLVGSTPRCIATLFRVKGPPHVLFFDKPASDLGHGPFRCPNLIVVTYIHMAFSRN